jgi:iron complex transport system substrate-binding protein
LSEARQFKSHGKSAGRHRLEAFILALACALLACSPNRSIHESSRTIVDELGRTITIPEHAGRIVSLAPSITETLFALGVGDRVAGVTSYCDYPPEATLKEKVGDTLKPNIERIVGIKADLVIVSTSSQLEQYIQSLEGLGIPVYISNPRNLDQVLQSITSMGRLVGAEDRARELVSDLRARIDRVTLSLSSTDRPRVLFLLGTEPLITVGGGTFMDDLIIRAGGRSISTDAGGEYPQYSMETAVAKQPEVIFVQFDEKQLPDRLKQTPAGRANRVYHLDDDLVSRPGPRIVDGLEQMASKIHPEVSWQ